MVMMCMIQLPASLLWRMKGTKGQKVGMAGKVGKGQKRGWRVCFYLSGPTNTCFYHLSVGKSDKLTRFNLRLRFIKLRQLDLSPDKLMRGALVSTC